MNYITLIKIPFLSFLGKISFEIYVIHGFFMILYRKGLTIGNEALYALTVIVSSLIFAAVLHPAVAKIYDLCRIERK